MNPLESRMWRQSVLLAVSSFRMEAMAAEGFAS